MESYEWCLNALRRDRQLIERDGLRMEIKRVPDSVATGVVDGRVLEDYLKSGGVVYPANPAAMTPADVALLRAQMGSPNSDLSSGIMAEIRFIGANRIPVYIYAPESGAVSAAVCYIHGGGFLGGCALMAENACKMLAQKINGVVFSVEYRLSPEHPFPSAFNDCREALDWIFGQKEFSGWDSSTFSVAGDSAGGNLATVCALAERDSGMHRIRNQILLYPALNIGKLDAAGPKWDGQNYEMNGDKAIQKLLIRDVGVFNDFIAATYVNSRDDLLNPYVTPLLARSLSGMPRTLIVTAEYDYLRLECEEYARRLARDGVSCRILRYGGVCHAFAEGIGKYPQAEDCIDEISEFVLQKKPSVSV